MRLRRPLPAVQGDTLHIVGVGDNRIGKDHRTSFAERGISDHCHNLTFSAKDYGDVAVDARGQFTTAAVALILNLTNRSNYVSKKGLKSEDWPY